jgi:thermostable 8-oxoguanine DNA glycosylase
MKVAFDIDVESVLLFELAFCILSAGVAAVAWFRYASSASAIQFYERESEWNRKRCWPIENEFEHGGGI